MEIEILEKAVRLAQEINNLNEHKEELNNILQRKEFIFEIQNGYKSHFKFGDELMPNYFKQFIWDYSQRLEEKIKEYQEELNKI